MGKSSGRVERGNRYRLNYLSTKARCLAVGEELPRILRDSASEQASQIIPFPALPARSLYATVARRYLDVQKIKMAPIAERPVDSCVVRIVRSPQEDQFLRLHKPLS